MKKTLIVGTVAYDDIETNKGNSGKILGGAGTYIALACSHFESKASIVSVVGSWLCRQAVVHCVLLPQSSPLSVGPSVMPPSSCAMRLTTSLVTCFQLDHQPGTRLLLIASAVWPCTPAPLLRSLPRYPGREVRC